MQEHCKQRHQHTNVLVRKCHVCGQLLESHKEEEKCLSCGKAFLPLAYFDKVHDHSEEYNDLFATVDEIDEEMLIKGLFVIW